MGVSTTASGGASTAMGYQTTASGDNSTAMGSDASTNGFDGSFVYGDNSGTSTSVISPNAFVVRAQRVWFGKSGNQTIGSGRYIETSTGAYLSNGGDWTNASSRALKHFFAAENADSVLERVAALPVQSWSYRAESPSVRHLGPTAEDFYAAFGLGDGAEAIGTGDLGGVNLLAVQALERRTRALQEQLNAKDQEISTLNRRIVELAQRLERLEAVLR